ncbi:protein PLASTID REDOX INSENSITIVE 2 [Citrus sinensis]|uniref:Protein PLASTID REDOX INSENSITIVE 2 n=1 Tax=Citrus sinensis TaxID=2711 RepID=A0ACB8LIX6_CITSI|nr:protein PLASTID REDOX INSENSITIVE 2 [Citrus sinensis]
MACSCNRSLISSKLDPCSPFSSSSPRLAFHRNSSVLLGGGIKLHDSSTISKKAQLSPLSFSASFRNHICRAAEYKFPDPIPEFADSETQKFRTHLLNKLAKKDMFGDSLEDVVGICTEGPSAFCNAQELWSCKVVVCDLFVGKIFSTFLHSEYGGPGTLLVLPFIDMADTLNERGLPGGPQAARAAVKWAQRHVDKDWKEWTGDSD